MKKLFIIVINDINDKYHSMKYLKKSNRKKNKTYN